MKWFKCTDAFGQETVINIESIAYIQKDFTTDVRSINEGDTYTVYFSAAGADFNVDVTIGESEYARLIEVLDIK